MVRRARETGRHCNVPTHPGRRQGCTHIPQAVKSPAQSVAPSPRAPFVPVTPLPTADQKAIEDRFVLAAPPPATPRWLPSNPPLIGPELVDLHNIKDVHLARMQEYDIPDPGHSTWDFGELGGLPESRWEDIADLHLEGRIIALFGMGDQLGYGEWYQDAPRPAARSAGPWGSAGGLLAQRGVRV